MRILEQIVGILNDRLRTGVLSSSYFQNGNFHGLAYLSNPTDDSPSKPYVLDNNCPKDVIIDDRDDFSIYHRVQNITFRELLNTYGDGDGMINMVCEMYAVAFCDQTETTYTPVDLALAISSGLNCRLTPSELGNSKIQSVKSLVSRANVNGSQVFSGEYGKDGHNPMQLTTVMVGITYLLEITAHSSCLNCSTC